MNLLYCGNSRVFDGMLISLLSICKYDHEELQVYVMTMDMTRLDEKNKPVTQEQINYLEQVIRETNDNSRIHLIDITEQFAAEMLPSPNLENSYTPYTLVRLFADEVEEMPEQILYLDTDTMAHGSIAPIFDYDIMDYEYAGIIDYLGKIFIRYNYINAGILYLNLAKIRETGLFRKCRERCRNKKMAFPDQTALNFLAKKKLFLPTKYNEQRKFREDTVIQHFCKSIRWLPFFHTVNYKPWQIEGIHEVYHLYEYDDILEEYQERLKEYQTVNAVG